MFSPQPLFITELVHEDFTSSDILAFSGADKKKNSLHSNLADVVLSTNRLAKTSRESPCIRSLLWYIKL